MKLMCKLFGHKWTEWRIYLFGTQEERFCRRCYITDKRITRSELDESENVFGEEQMKSSWKKQRQATKKRHIKMSRMKHGTSNPRNDDICQAFAEFFDVSLVGAEMGLVNIFPPTL